MQPKLINGDGTLVLELISPFTAVLVVGVFPFRANTLLEEMVVGFKRKLRGLSDIVLETNVLASRIFYRLA